jgi:glycosyltransferase involved in cell wall biosynthesis
MAPNPIGAARRAKLLVLTSTYPRWAGDHEPGFVHELSRRLARDLDVIVIAPHAPGAAKREMLDGVDVRRYRYAPDALEALVQNGGIVTNLKRAKWKWLLVPGFLLAQAVAVWRTLRRDRPNVIHGHWLIPQGLLLALLSLLLPRMPPFLLTSHGADLFSLRGRIAELVRRWVIGRAAAVTVVSTAMREMLLRTGVDPAKVSVQSMGVDLTERFTPTDLPRSRDEILFVGRLVEKKGLRHLLDALPAIHAWRASVFLTIAGFGPEEAALREQARRLGLDQRVRFVGAVHQAELPKLYRRAAVFVAPFVEARGGDQEGLGLVVIEAAGCNCPVVLSRLPATEGLLAAMPGFTAVAPGDASALAAAVIATLQQPAEIPRDGVLGYDWTARTLSYRELLSQLA